MRYSLSSRFCGTLIGAVLEEAGIYPEQHQQPGGWSKLVILSAESLIGLGKFDLQNWREIHNEYSAAMSTKAIIVTLPVVLFYHENETKLRQNLLSLTSIWPNDPVLRDGALAVGYAIAQSLTEKLNPNTLIAQTISFLGEPQTGLAQQMAQVQTLLAQGAALERAVNQLSRDALPSTPVAMAFYCFLSTIEDLRLSVLRAARTQYQPQITTAITGALSGAYNSVAGIPTNLRSKPYKIDSKPLGVWETATEPEMLHLSDSILAVWSGVYDWTTSGVGVTPVQAIAAPRVMRLR